MSKLIIIRNGLWTTGPHAFTFHNELLTEEHRGITRGFVERSLEMADEIGQFRRLEEERQRREYEQALNNLGQSSLFLDSEEDTPNVVVVGTGGDSSNQNFLDIWNTHVSNTGVQLVDPEPNPRENIERTENLWHSARRSGRREEMRNHMSRLRNSQLQTGEIDMIEYLDQISQEE